MVGLLDGWIFGLLDCWMVGLLDFWIVGFLDCWIIGLLDCWVEISHSLASALKGGEREILVGLYY